MDNTRTPLQTRVLIYHKRLLFVAAAISALYLFYLPALFVTHESWHELLHILPPASQSNFSHGATPPNSFPSPSTPEHQVVEGSRLKAVMGGRHPLHELIANAEAKWIDMVESQSTTLDSAIEEYQRRYGRRPPLGFDKWYDFARRVGFKLIDEFDQIDRDITPFLALPYHIMKQRLDLVSKDDHSYHFTIQDGNSSLSGPLAHWDIAAVFQELIQDFVQDLPGIKFYVSGHDGGPTILPEDMRLAVNTALGKGQRLTEKEVSQLEDLERNPRRGVANACLEDPVTSYPSALPERNIHAHTFIHDHRASMSFCTNPTILNNPTKRHGYFAYDIPHQRWASPLFVQSQLSTGGALLHPALQSYLSADVYAKRFGPIVPWANRTEKLFWRGRTTGEWFSRAHDWRFSHRIRIHTLTTPGGNRADPNVTPEVEVLVEGTEPGQGVRLQTYSRDVLNEEYMDVGLIGGPVQCDDSDEDHTCQTMAAALTWAKELGWEAGLNSKFLLDVDGNGWSSRFQRLLSSGAVVFKMTIFPEWNSDWLIPYYHYVPIQTDYSDLYDTLVFFRGTPDGVPGYDNLARKIGAHAHEFTANHWRIKDMQVYIYRLLLEYARMVAEDREAMTMA